MGETGFRLLLQPPKTYLIENRDTTYRLTDNEGYWGFEHLEKGIAQPTMKSFRTLAEIEQFLIVRLRELKHQASLEQHNAAAAY
jgi:hypothetical protein